MQQVLNSTSLESIFNVNISDEWSFEECRSVNLLTHGYHRYPAKFIPQIVKKLIEKYTIPGDKIVDVFAGCGTTLVESKVHGRMSEGVDINPVAQLITQAKINPIEPLVIEEALQKIEFLMNSFDERQTYFIETHPRIDYWFRTEEKNKLAYLHKAILKFDDEKTKIFLLCALSNILKNCSRWLQSGTKPQIDPNKVISEPFSTFKKHLKKMQKKNIEFHYELLRANSFDVDCNIRLADARSTQIESNSTNAIITSPPYVTSYEYADIHQLTGYWFEYISDITKFRKDFIGTFYSNNKNLTTRSSVAEEIVTDLSQINTKNASEVANYFNDMYDVIKEMNRILKPGGVVCMVVGNTTMKGIKIKSAEAFAQMLSNLGLTIEQVIKRKIPFKLIPTIRDEKSGKFTTLTSTNKKLVYPEEFIIIARK